MEAAALPEGDAKPAHADAKCDVLRTVDADGRITDGAADGLNSSRVHEPSKRVPRQCLGAALSKVEGARALAAWAARPVAVSSQTRRCERVGSRAVSAVRPIRSITDTTTLTVAATSSTLLVVLLFLRGAKVLERMAAPPCLRRAARVRLCEQVCGLYGAQVIRHLVPSSWQM